MILMDIKASLITMCVLLLMLWQTISAVGLEFLNYINYIFGLTYPTYFQNSATYAHESMVVFYDNMMNILFYTIGVVIIILCLTILIFNNNDITIIRNIIFWFKKLINKTSAVIFSVLIIIGKKNRNTLVTFINTTLNSVVNFFHHYIKIGFIRRRYYKHESLTEAIWTIIPFCIIGIIATPSFHLLYLLAEISEPVLTLKIIGHQWYWSYEYGDFIDDSCSIAFDSYMIPSDDLEKGQLRLLDVDNHVLLPINTTIRLVITSSDVIHCWTIPNFGVKVDACPGRLSQTTLYLPYKGCYYGQCSEICGLQHGFMPIVVEAVSNTHFKQMINSSIG